MNKPIEDLIWKAGLRRGLRPATIKTYVYTVGKFLRCYHLEPHRVTKAAIENHLLRLIKEGRAGSTVNVHLQALCFFFREVLGKRLFIGLPPIRLRKRLPECLSQEEMSRFLAAITNLKHRLILIFTYGSGFRVSEVIGLKVKDLDLKAGYGWIRDGKGGKDRMFIIPEKLKAELREWIAAHGLQPDDWLFPGYKQQHYSDSSVREIVEKAARAAGLSMHHSKPITPHTLRHSFATHLLENGYSLMEVNKLLGHSRLETTMVYAHLADVKLTRVQSPYDALVMGGEAPAGSASGKERRGTLP